MNPHTLKATLTAWKESERERSVQQYPSFASFCPPCLHSSYPPAFRVARSALLSSDLNTGPVVDALSTRPTGADKLLASPSEPRGRKLNRATGNPHLPPDHWCWEKRLNDAAQWRDGKSLNVQFKPENMYFGDNLQPHLEGLNMAFVLPLLAVKLVLLCVTSLPLFLSLQLISMLQLALLLACASMYKQYGIHLNDLTLHWTLYCREKN